MSENKLKAIVPNEKFFIDDKKLLFEQIKVLQSLPDEIVEGFLKSKGKLSHFNFSKKLLSNEK